MEEIEENKRKFKDKLKDQFRLVVLNDDTLQEVSTYRLSLLNLYLLISSAIVLLGLFIVLILIATPLKTLLPGYGEIEANKEFLELTRKTQELEQDIVAMEEYIQRSKSRLVGESSAELQDSIKSEDETSTQMDIDLNPISVNQSPKKQISKAKLGQFYLLPPVNGPISADFDPNQKHFGVDILAPKNTAIKAIMDGYVIASDWTLESGNTVAIQHANNIVSFYKHNSSILKKAGSFVQAGEAIAIIGNSGTLSDGPHLHFELWYNGVPVNPSEFINF